MPARPAPGKRDEQQQLGSDRDQPHPPWEAPELPLLHAAHGRKQQLGRDHERDRRRRLPAGLDLLLVERSISHQQIVRVGIGRVGRSVRQPLVGGHLALSQGARSAAPALGLTDHDAHSRQRRLFVWMPIASPLPNRMTRRDELLLRRCYSLLQAPVLKRRISARCACWFPTLSSKVSELTRPYGG